MITFNKNIFICWFQGKSHLDNYHKSIIFNENIQNWQLLNPSWNVYLIDDQQLRDACKTNSIECLKTYDSFQIMHQKIDFGRYILLYLYGGIYVDMDMYVLRGFHTSKKFNKLLEMIKLNKKHILGLSISNSSWYETYMFIGKHKFINNAIMISSQYNPIIKKYIDCIMEKSLETNFDEYNQIQNTTGPCYLNKFIDIYKHKFKNVHIEYFPHYYFEPAPAFDKFDIRDETIAIHKMELSWISNGYKNALKSYYIIKPYFLVIFIVIFVVIIFLILLNKNKIKKLNINRLNN
jgi:mannosyltransferase OCH1-like enzyme